MYSFDVTSHDEMESLLSLGKSENGILDYFQNKPKDLQPSPDTCIVTETNQGETKCK